MSNNLNLDQMAANQNQKEQTHNDSNGQLDAAITEILSVDLSGGSATLTTDQFQRNRQFVATSAAADQSITLPAIKREFSVHNNTTFFVSIVMGTTTIVLPPNVAGIFQTDGTANGLIQVADFGGDSTQVDRNGVAQTITSATKTKLELNNIVFGNSAEYDAVTNYRHTPKVAGLWRYSLTVTIAGMASPASLVASIAKNAADVAVHEQEGVGTTKPVSVSFSKLVQMNGTTDYIECFVTQDSGASLDVDGTTTRTYLDIEYVHE